MSDDRVVSARVHRTRRDLARQPDRRLHAALAFRVTAPDHDLIADLLYGRPISAEDRSWIANILEAIVRRGAPKGTPDQ